MTLQNYGNMPVLLDGWDDFSVWGWDSASGCLFAQLWRNEDNVREAPRAWVGAGSSWPSTSSPAVLAEYVAMATGGTVREAAEALAASAPAEVRETLKLAAG